MKTLTALKAKAEEARSSQAYRAEGASIRFTEDLAALIETNGCTRSTGESVRLLSSTPVFTN